MSTPNLTDKASSEDPDVRKVDSVSLDIEKDERLSIAEIKRIQRRIDWRLMPWLCLTYLVMRIDVNNTANAAVMNIKQGHGIEKELHLSAQQWAWVVSCFFYPYGALEPLSTLLMKKTTPSFWIGRIMITWGIIVCCIASVQNYAGLIATRVLLGAAEAGYYPCIIYYLAFWFKWDELALRIAAFYSFGQVSGFVSGFIAYAVSFADGRLAGWRWLFVIEGFPAILMGVVTLFLLPDYPQTATFLTQRERDAIIARLSKNAPTKTSDTWDAAQVRALVVDPTFWTFGLVWFCHAVGGFGLSYVLPTVIYELEVVNIICCVLLITVKESTVKYLALVASTATAGSVYPILWPARVHAARGTTAAGVAIGATNAIAQFSGIIRPQVFDATYGPSYRTSFLICIGLLGGAIFSVVLSGLLMQRQKGKQNVKRRTCKHREQGLKVVYDQLGL